MQAGSITFSTALDNKTLEAGLTRLKKQVLKLEDEMSVKSFKKSALIENLREAKKELAAISDDPGQYERAGELRHQISAMEKEVAKYQASLDNTNLTLEAAKLRYGEIAAEAERLRSIEESGAGNGAAPENRDADERWIHRQEEAQKRWQAVSERMQTELGSLRELISLVTGDAKAKLSTFFDPLLERAAPVLDRVREAVSARLEPLRDMFGPVMEEAKNGLSIGMQGILSGLSGAMNRIGPLVQEGASGLSDGFSAMLSAAKGAIAGLPGLLLTAAAVGGKAISALAPRLSGLLKKAFSAAASAAKAFGKTLTALGKGVLSLGKTLMSAAGEMNVLTKLSDAVGKKLKRLAGTLRQVFMFSVIAKGLRAVETQMTSYLSLNVQFTASTRRLQGVLLTAFQPIYNVVVPALTALINALSKAIAVVSQFFAALFGTTAKQAQSNAEALYNQADAMGAAGEAAEEASLQMASFDEINQLQDTSSGGGGGGGTGAEAGPLFDWSYDETPFDSWGEAFSAFLDNLLEGIPQLKSAFDAFAANLNTFSGKLLEMFTFPGVKEKVELLGRELADAFNGLADKINWEQLGRALGAGLNLALQFLTEFLYEFDWINLGRKLADLVNGLVSETDWYDFGRLLWAGFKVGLETLAGFLENVNMPELAKAASDIIIGFFDEMDNTINRINWPLIGQQIAAFLNEFQWYESLTSVFAAIADGIMGLKTMIDEFLSALDWESIATEIYTAINDSIGKVDWAGLGSTIGNFFTTVLDFARTAISGINWAQIGADIAAFLNGIDWVGALSSLAGFIAAGINAAVHALGTMVADLNWAEVGAAFSNAINRTMKEIDFAAAGRMFSDVLNGMIVAAISYLETRDWTSTGKAIVTFFENIDWIELFKNLGKLIGDAITGALEVIMADPVGFLKIGAEIVAGILAGIVGALAGIGTWLYNNLVKPIVDGVKDLLGIHSPSTVFFEIGTNLIAGLLQGISETWSGIVEFFSEKAEALKSFLSESWENIKTTAAGKWSEIKTSLGETWETIKTTASEKFDAVKDKIAQAWETASTETAEKWSAIKAALGETWDNLKTDAETAFGHIREKIGTAWENAKTETAGKWTEITTSLSGTWENVKANAETSFGNIKDAITGIWNELNTSTGNIWDDIWGSIKGVINSILGGVETMVNGVIKGLNKMINALNSLKFDVPDWVPAIGGSKFGFNIPTLNTISIPRLAQGAVIPPNREFLAVLGDQKSGTNIETPLLTMIQAFKQAMSEMGVTGGGNMTVTLELDGRELGRAAVKYGGAEYQRIGTRLVEART